MSRSEVPIWALTHLTHAALAHTAARSGCDLLHIKGPATSPSLRAGRHDSSDADVLVRPAHLDRFIAALESDGWTLATGFEEGSPFGHAANFEHPSWTYADVHRNVPGPLAPADEVFDRLWRERRTAPIGRHPCQVLSLAGQVLIQTLHAARSHDLEKPEAWTLCPDDLRDEVRRLAAELRAETAFAAGIGTLDRHRDAPDYALWSYWSRAETDRLDEWIARVRSAPSPAEKWRVIRQGMQVNRTHLRLRLEREPTRGEVAREQFDRLSQGIRSVTRRLRGREELP